MLILVFLGMYFDAAVVFVKTFLLLFRLALAILCVHFLGSWVPLYNQKAELAQLRANNTKGLLM